MAEVSLVGLSSDEYHWTQLARYLRQQAITWASIDPDLYPHEASLGHKLLTPGALTKLNVTWREIVFLGRRHKGSKIKPVDIPVLIY